MRKSRRIIAELKQRLNDAVQQPLRADKMLDRVFGGDMVLQPVVTGQRYRRFVREDDVVEARLYPDGTLEAFDTRGKVPAIYVVVPLSGELDADAANAIGDFVGRVLITRLPGVPAHNDKAVKVYGSADDLRSPAAVAMTSGVPVRTQRVQTSS